MVALRDRPLAAFSVTFWLCALSAALMPTSIGYQDLAAYLARQPGVSERWRDHLIASPFGTIHAATFNFARPIGTTVSEPMDAQTINFDPRSLDVKVWIGNNGSPLVHAPVQVAYPSVNRRLKGDRTAPPQPASTSNGTETVPQLQPIAPAAQPASPPAPSVSPTIGPRPKSAEQRDDGLAPPLDAFGYLPPGLSASEDVTGSLPPPAAAAPERNAARDGVNGSVPDDDALLVDKPPEIPSSAESAEGDTARESSQSYLSDDPAERNAQVFFGGGVMGGSSSLEQWPLGAAPVVTARTPDPEIKQSALEAPLDPGPGGESVAGKDDPAPQGSPAERLGLEGKERAKAEKCLADAIYFESRGEEKRGQMAVAQVIMNRVFSGYYPNNVCGVVYQNANRHLRCQFTFACEGKDLSKVDELDMWEQAKSISRDMLDGKIWLSEVGHATHYHAYWVHPSWVHEMKKMYRLGVHTFYRPRAWTDVPEGPVWASVPVPAKAANPAAEAPDATEPVSAKEPPAPEKSPEASVKVPQASASPDPEAAGASAPL